MLVCKINSLQLFQFKNKKGERNFFLTTANFTCVHTWQAKMKIINLYLNHLLHTLNSLQTSSSSHLCTPIAYIEYFVLSSFLLTISGQFIYSKIQHLELSNVIKNFTSEDLLNVLFSSSYSHLQQHFVYGTYGIYYTLIYSLITVYFLSYSIHTGTWPISSQFLCACHSLVENCVQAYCWKLNASEKKQVF